MCAAVNVGIAANTSEQLEVGDDKKSPARARHALYSLMREAGWPAELVDAACLALSEVVTNAIVHGGGVARTEVEIEPRRLVVSVTDRNAEPPIRRLPDAASPDGRGLMLLEVLSDRWGYASEVAAAAKCVWFELLRSPPMG